MIISIRGDKIRVGIAVPKSIPVHRKEVYETIHRGTDDKTKTRYAERHF